MVGTNFMDELDCVNFYDHIDDLLDFPSDDLDTDLMGTNGGCDFPSIMPGNSSDDLLGSDSVFSGNSASDLSAELSVPYEDIVQLEWLSTFVEDSFSGGGMTMNNKSTEELSQSQFHTSSPVSVLESSSSSCSNPPKTVPMSHEKRARSKRPRPATFSPRPAIHLVSPPTSSLAEAIFVPCTSSSESGITSDESQPSKNFLANPPVLGDQPKKKKKKIKITLTPNSNSNPNVAAEGGAVRKCLHCEITKTPQWRAGPMGPKTLCNACGVRYKSGRLFPEYRPAASPTFVPSVHSNSHKKVLEMRTNPIHATTMEPLEAPRHHPDLIPRSDLLPSSI